MVLRTSPEPGQEQPLDAPIEITFDQPMDRASVEKAFAVSRPVYGNLPGKTTRQCSSPSKMVLRGERYRVRVVETAKSQAAGDAAPL
jgi:hypothetical protein